MFRSNDDTTATTPFVATGPSGLDRLYAACMATSSHQPSAETLLDYLESLRLLWDLPSLTLLYPEVVEHLEARYLADRRGDEITVSSTVHGGSETFAITDMRHVVDVLLSREYRDALWRERVLPSFERLVG